MPLRVVWLQSLETVGQNLRTDHLARGNVGATSERDAGKDSASGTNPAVFSNDDRTPLVPRLGALAFLHAANSH